MLLRHSVPHACDFHTCQRWALVEAKTGHDCPPRVLAGTSSCSVYPHVLKPSVCRLDQLGIADKGMCKGHVQRACGVTRRKLQTPGTAEEHKRQETPTINPNERQPTQFTEQAPGTIERAARESRHTTPISTAAVHTFSTATTGYHHPHPTVSSPDPLSQRSPLRSTGGLSRATPQTSSASAGTQKGHVQGSRPDARDLHEAWRVRSRCT